MRGGLSERACRLLAGADTGVAGGVVVLIWLSFFARMQGDYWWSKWNVAGALFYGDRVFIMGLGLASIAGAALLLVLYAAIGAAFSVLGRPRGFAFNLLAGLTLALLWHQVADWLLWPRLHPSAPRFFHPLVMLPANVLYGAALLRFGPRFRRIAVALGDPGWASQFRPPAAAVPVPPPEPPAEVRPEEEDPGLRPPDC
jgi:hypothetical protein